MGGQVSVLDPAIDRVFGNPEVFGHLVDRDPGFGYQAFLPRKPEQRSSNNNGFSCHRRYFTRLLPNGSRADADLQQSCTVDYCRLMTGGFFGTLRLGRARYTWLERRIAGPSFSSSARRHLEGLRGIHSQNISARSATVFRSMLPATRVLDGQP